MFIAAKVFGENSNECALLLGRMSQTYREKRDFKVFLCSLLLLLLWAHASPLPLPQRARELAGRNLELARKCGDDADHGMALHLIGDIAFAENNYEEALK